MTRLPGVGTGRFLPVTEKQFLIMYLSTIRILLGMTILLVTASCRELGTQDSASSVGPADFWVAPAGNDANPGTKMRPFATFTRARDAVREFRKVRPNSDVLVLFRGGTYRIKQLIEFTPEDSGRAGGHVTYAAASGEKPIISGGCQITGFKASENGLWKTIIPEARDGKWRIEQLYINGRRAVRARSPNQFYYYMDGTIASGIDPVTGKTGSLNDHTFLAHHNDVVPLLAMPPERLREVVVSAYHSWEISRHHIVAVEAKKNEVYLTGRYPPKFYHYTRQERYYIENFIEALDVPGEWFLDRDGTLYYKPFPGEDMNRIKVVAPVAETLIQLTGTGEDQPVANITFRGLSFQYAAYLMPSEGQWSCQAACEVGAAITADYTKNVVFMDCEIEHTGTYGIWFRDGCRHCIVNHCFLNDLGAGGVRLGQTLPKLPKPSEITSHIKLDNNIIQNAGRLWPDAVGVLIGHSGDNQVTHNDISGMAYTGISVGWRWGYGEIPSVRNSILFNHIHHLGWDVLADMGGIYTLGEAPGTVLGNNVIHDIDGDGHSGMHGLYNDNSTSLMVLENNLVYNVRDGGYQIGSGKGNILRNNVFVARSEGVSTHGQLLFCMYYPTEQHLAATFEKNIIYGSGGKLFSVPATFGERLQFRNNLYWEPSGKPLDFVGKSFDAWQKLGYDANSVVVDPKFVDPAKHDFRLQPNSPALALGFVPIDYSQAGVYGNPAWIRRARNVQYPPYAYSPPPPPVTFFDDFENTPVGSLPVRSGSMVEGKGDSIAVTEETATGGKQSLKITDATNLTHSFNPHFWYSPEHRAGTSTLAFDLRLDEGAELTLEWREYPGKPYFYTGPRMVFRKGKLFVTDQQPLDIPVGAWFHVEITAGLGPSANGTWQLAVTLQGAEPKRFSGLKFGSPETRSVTWIGFISGGSHKSVYYVDNVRLCNSLISK